MRSILVANLLIIVFSLWINNGKAQNIIVLQPGPEAGKDARVWSLAPDSNFGAYEFTKANAWTWGGTFGIERTYLQFNLDIIPDSAIIIDARLSLYYHNLPGNPEQTHSGDNSLLIQRVTSQWDEYGVNWNNQPSVTENNMLVVPPSAGPQSDYLDLNVTGMIQDMVNDAENSFGFLIKILKEELYRRVGLSSSDHPVSDKWPKLVITLDCEPPTAGFEIFEDELCFTLTDTSLNATEWLWDFGDGYSSCLQNPVHCYAQEGVYYLCLIASNECGADTLCEIVRPELTSVNEYIAPESLSVFPNPAHDKAYIRFHQSEALRLNYEILDISGRRVASGILHRLPDYTENSLDVSGFLPGIYFVLPDPAGGFRPARLIVY